MKIEDYGSLMALVFVASRQVMLLGLGFSILHARFPSSFPFLLPLVIYTLRTPLIPCLI